MSIKTIFAFLMAVAASCVSVYADPPEIPSGGNGPSSGGGNPGGGGDPGGGGSSRSLTYDSFITVTTNANCLVREGVLYGYTSSLTTSVAPTASGGATVLADGVFAGNTAITAVNLANTSITEIPSDCFAGCTALRTVTLPSSVTSIGANAFANCSALSSVTASGVTSVGADAFRGCTALATLPTTASSATYGDYAFAQSGLTSANVSSKTLSEGTFAGCALLASLANASPTLPAALCSGCTSLTFDPSGCTSLGKAALAGVPFTSLTLDSSVSLADCSLAADEATVVTLLVNSSVPDHTATTFLGREVSYNPVSGSVARIDAENLVEWLMVNDPQSSYSTAALKTWLSDANNAYAYAYASQIAADSDFAALAVSGTNFIFHVQDDATASVLTVSLQGSYSLDADHADWSEANLTQSETDSNVYTAAVESNVCFARLSFNWTW